MSVRDLIMLKHLVLSATFDHWITLIEGGDPGGAFHYMDSKVWLDATDGFFFTIYEDENPGDTFHLVKLSLDGAIIASKKNTSQGSPHSADRVCIAGTKGYMPYQNSSGDLYLLEFNKSDLTHSLTKVTSESGDNIGFRSFLPDDSGNLFFFALGGYGSGLGSIFGKLVQSTFATTWSKNYTTDAFVGSLYGLNASNSAFFIGDRAGELHLVRMSSAGAVTWQKKLALSPSALNSAVLTGASNTFFDTPYFDTISSTILHVVNSSGSVTWSRHVTHTVDIGTLAVTSDGSNYFTLLSDSNTGGLYLLKLSSSGGVSFKRRLDCTDNTLEGKTLQWLGDKLYLFTGMYNTTSGLDYRVVALCLPDDGTLTGTHVVDGYSFVYATTTDLTVATETHTSSTTTLSFGVPEYALGVGSTTLTTTTLPLTQGEVA